MKRSPYSRFRGQPLTLNDYLAIDRTVLANERTLLAYGRTALALVVVGGSCLKFFEVVWINVLGIAFMIVGAVISLKGWQRYVQTRHLLAAALEHETGAPEHPLADEVTGSSETAARKKE